MDESTPLPIAESTLGAQDLLTDFLRNGASASGSATPWEAIEGTTSSTTPSNADTWTPGSAYRDDRKELIGLVLELFGKPAENPDPEGDPWVLPVRVGDHLVVVSNYTADDTQAPFELVVPAPTILDLEKGGAL